MGVLFWPALVGLLLIGLLVVWRSRYVSLTSISGAAAAPLLFLLGYLTQGPDVVPPAYVVYAVVGAALVIASHRDNIQRLRAGTESRLGQRVPRAA